MDQEFLDNFEKEDIFSESPNEIIYRVKHKVTHELYFMKEIDTTAMSDHEKENESEKHELNKTLNCDYIWSYINFCDGPELISILLTPMNGGTLSEYLSKYHILLPEEKVWWFFIQICLGVEYLHSRDIVFKNLKSSNIFLDKSEQLKIGNLDILEEQSDSYALEFDFKPKFSTGVKSMEKSYSKKGNIWSLGWILYEICQKKPPFEVKASDAFLPKHK